MQLAAVDKRTGLTRKTFAEEYLRPRRPVVFTDLMDTWAAKEKWTIDYFKNVHGDLRVPVVDNEYGKPGKNYMKSAREIPFREYLETIEAGPTDMRMFLFNIFRHVPELCNDFQTPTIMDGFIDSYPFMFFGGEGAVVNLHYDIDMSNVFLNQFHGRKRVMLFSPEQSPYLYHQPFTVKSTVDILKPDYQRFPALKKLRGYEVMLEPGETLFMPSGYWHHVEYVDAGYSISLRSNDSITTRAKGLLNIATHFVVDKGMNRIWGNGWNDYKLKSAERRATAAM